MKRTRALFFLILVLATGLATAAYAQPEVDRDNTPGHLSRRAERRLRKEERDHERDAEQARDKKQAEGPKGPPRPVSPLLGVKHEVVYPATEMKKRYRIDVLTPLYLDELVRGDAVTFKDKIPEKAAQGVAFYQGVNIAADRLKKSGYNIDIYIHDIGSYAESPEMLLSNRKLDSTDLILAGLQARDIPDMAGYARRKHVNLVSVLSPADGGVKDNPFFTLVQPSLRSHCEWIAGDLEKKFHDQKVVVLYRTSVPGDENAYKYLTGDVSGKVKYKALQCNALPRRSELAGVFDTGRPNVVVVPILDIVFADSILHRLARYFPGTHFEVYGMPPWNEITTLRSAKSYPNLTVKVTYPFNFSTADEEALQNFEEAFGRMYGGKPSDMAYRGYETLLWYAALLKKYGTVFNAKYNDNSAAPFTRYEVKPQWDKYGGLLYNENRHLFLSTYQGGIFTTE